MIAAYGCSSTAWRALASGRYVRRRYSRRLIVWWQLDLALQLAAVRVTLLLIHRLAAERSKVVSRRRCQPVSAASGSVGDTILSSIM